MIISFLVGWMFLPATGYDIPGFPDYTKVSATNVGVMLAAAVFDMDRLLSFRPRLLDVPMFIWCLCPFASSVTNGLGYYDGASAVLSHVIMWGIPYFVGRVYLNDLQGLRELGVLFFVGGLIYVPFCLWEIRMSPNLNYYIYGFGAAGIEYVSELGKWGSRPNVFMGTALTVGMFMTATSLMGMWLWATGSLKRVWGISTGWLVLLLMAITIGCKNMGAISLLLFGLAAFFAIKWFRTPVLVYLLILVSPLYMAVRASGRWSATPLVEMVAAVHQRRADSLQTRLDNENRLSQKALQRPVFGWGRWGRNRVYNEQGEDISLTDGLWIIALGYTGIVGLAALTSTLLLPPLIFLRRFAVRSWLHPAIAPAGALAVLVALYVIDNLFNAMYNPIYMVAIGGLVCWCGRRGGDGLRSGSVQGRVTSQFPPQSKRHNARRGADGVNSGRRSF